MLLSRWSRAAPYSLLATRCLYPPEAMQTHVGSDVFWLIVKMLEAAQNIRSCGSFFSEKPRSSCPGERFVSRVVYRIVSYRIILCRIVSYHIVSYRIVPYRVRMVVYRIVSHRIVSYRSRSGSIAYYIRLVSEKRPQVQLKSQHIYFASNAFIHQNPS